MMASSLKTAIWAMFGGLLPVLLLFNALGVAVALDIERVTAARNSSGIPNIPTTSSVQPGAFGVQGSFVYLDLYNKPMPARLQKVELLNAGLIESHLAWSTTNEGGEFLFQTDDQGNPLSFGIAGIGRVSVRVFAENPSVVRVASSLIADVLGSSYSAHFGPFEVLGASVDLGQCVVPVEVAGAWHIYDTILLTHDWFGQQTRFYRPAIDVYWPYGDRPVHRGLLFNRIDLPGGREWETTTIVHEYAHAIMYSGYGNALPPTAHEGEGHWPDSEKDGGFALTEGWAEFIEAAVANDPQIVWRWFQDIENNDWYDSEDSGDVDGNSVEGSAASIFWDIYDNPLHDDDPMHLGLNEIWTILKNNHPADIVEFWKYWFENSTNLAGIYGTWSSLYKVYQDYGVFPRPGTWSIEAPIAQARGERVPLRMVSLASDTSGELHAVFASGSMVSSQSFDYTIQYASKPADGSWSSPQPIPGTAGRVWEPKMAVDDQGDLHVVYRRIDDERNQTILHVMKSPDEQWTTPSAIAQVVYSQNPWFISYDTPYLAIAARKDVHVAWKDEGRGNGDIFYSTWHADSGWTSSVNVSANPTWSIQPSISVDPMERVHLLWVDTQNSYSWSQGQASIIHALKQPAESSFVSEVVGQGDSPSTVVNSSGSLHLAWNGEADGDLGSMYREWNAGQGWGAPEIIWTIAAGPRIAVDSAGKPHVVWVEGAFDAPALGHSRTWYSAKDGQGKWMPPFEIPQENGSVYQSYASVVIDKTDSVHVAWEAASDTDGWILYSKLTPTSSAVGSLFGNVRLQAQDKPDWYFDSRVIVQPINRHAGTTFSGNFSVSVPEGNYTVRISYPGHLPAFRDGVNVVAGVALTLTPVRLLAGDVNRDQTIDVSDLSLVARSWGTLPPPNAGADVNGDGKVDILDLVLVGINFGKTESPWP